MPIKSDNRFLFIHVMKTGGTSFADLLRANFADDERYPDALLSPESSLARRVESYTCVPRVVRDANDHAEKLRIVRAHVPYVVRDQLHMDYQAMTVLRDPVERTLSYLKHCRKYHEEHNHMSLEEIYEQEWFYESYMHNYQTKIFSMTFEECLSEERYGDFEPPLPPRSEFVEGQPLPMAAQKLIKESLGRVTLELFSPSTGIISADDARLDTAMDNLRQVELVGITEDYEKFLAALATRYDWKIPELPRKNVGEDSSVEPDFARRIARDNALDMQLYELARSLAP